MTAEISLLKKTLNQANFPEKITRIPFTRLMKKRLEVIKRYWIGDDQDSCLLVDALIAQYTAGIEPSKKSKFYLYLDQIKKAEQSLFIPPKHLIDEIKNGRCVAFVGAGFSCPAIPGWKSFLRTLIDHMPDHATHTFPGHEIDAMFDHISTSLDLETIGQIILNAYENNKDKSRLPFEEAIQKIVSSSNTSHAQSNVETRARLLRGIPFDSVITTNYDHFLPGQEPNAKHYADFLRTSHRWWDQRQWNVDPEQSTQRILKIHGDANGSDTNNPIILTRTDYRRRVYGDRSYSNFLKSLFASKTILFLGVSFSDAYLNELRSEILDMIGPLSDGNPRAYAILSDKTDAWRSCFKSTEGIEVLSYQSSNRGYEHKGFDRWLDVLHQETCAEAHLKSCLEGKKVIWLDPKNEQNNQYGFKWLSNQIGVRLEKLTSIKDLQQSAHQDAALLITSFGFQNQLEDSLAISTLKKVNQWSSGRPPVIVFADRDFADINRAQILRYGAYEFAVEWGELFRMIYELFSRKVGH